MTSHKYHDELFQSDIWILLKQILCKQVLLNHFPPNRTLHYITPSKQGGWGLTCTSSETHEFNICIFWNCCSSYITGQLNIIRGCHPRLYFVINISIETKTVSSNQRAWLWHCWDSVSQCCHNLSLNSVFFFCFKCSSTVLLVVFKQSYMSWCI